MGQKWTWKIQGRTVCVNDELNAAIRQCNDRLANALGPAIEVGDLAMQQLAAEQAETKARGQLIESHRAQLNAAQAKIEKLEAELAALKDVRVVPADPLRDAVVEAAVEWVGELGAVYIDGTVSQKLATAVVSLNAARKQEASR